MASSLTSTLYGTSRTVSLRVSCNATEPPSHQPVNIHHFLCNAIGQDDNTVKLLWEAFKWMGWDIPEGEGTMAYRQSEYLLPLFLKLGPASGVAFYELFPPHKICIDLQCTQGERKTKNHTFCKLTEPNTYGGGPPFLPGT
ncbi:hypothetical protein JB92DRAFT_939693 [Gautieria morchelliformis]|nr:hypothetical protein JB92DRAFT_939693 [Gautieria morchelliformis]